MPRTVASAVASNTATTLTGANANVDSSTGYTSAQISNHASNVAITSTNAAGIVRLGDVADVVDANENTNNFGTVNGKPSILITVFKSPGANVIETVDNVLKQLPLLRASISPAINLQVALDRVSAAS